jgi:hypothetical protein
MLGGYAEVDVTGADAVMFRVWDWNKEGQNPKKQDHQAYAKQGFHEKPPISDYCTIGHCRIGEFQNSVNIGPIV